MASIKINELQPAGYELFQDSESFLNDLNEQEMLATVGGRGIRIIIISQVTISIGISLVSNSVVTQAGGGAIGGRGGDDDD